MGVSLDTVGSRCATLLGGLAAGHAKCRERVKNGGAEE